ncbi:MAG: apolipoprotein N-acyltransferase, partial [Candidatus Aegiribacteria sp.]
VADGATWTTLARTLDSALLMGTIEREERDGEVCTFNSAVQVGPGGEVEHTKHKRMLVPFSEGTPYSRHFPFLRGLRIGGADHCRGESITVFRLSSAAYSTMICYEVAFASLNREAVQEGAEFLVTIMNNSWWGRSSIIWQHSCILPFRSVENRRWYACCSNSGFSFFCDPMGRVLGSTDLFTRTGTRWTIRSNDDITFYTRHGKWIELAAPLMALALLLLGGVRELLRRRGRTGLTGGRD